MTPVNRSEKHPKYVHCHLIDEDCCEDNIGILGWCFWDETGGCHGPWGTVQETDTAFETYMEMM